MKKIIFLMFFPLLIIGCGGANDSSNKKEGSFNKGEYVDVFYFHGKQRCATCGAIEKQTQDVINKYFANELAAGKIAFRIVDISKSENETIADKYEIAWSSLILVGHRGDKDTIVNMTEQGFKYAINDPVIFEDDLKREINNLLK